MRAFERTSPSSSFTSSSVGGPSIFHHRFDALSNILFPSPSCLPVRRSLITYLVDTIHIPL
jgi:hypothetical protein